MRGGVAAQLGCCVQSMSPRGVHASRPPSLRAGHGRRASAARLCPRAWQRRAVLAFSPSGMGCAPASCAISVGTCGGAGARRMKQFAWRAARPQAPPCTRRSYDRATAPARASCQASGPRGGVCDQQRRGGHTQPPPQVCAGCAPHPAVLDQVFEIDGRCQAYVHAERVARRNDLGAGGRRPRSSQVQDGAPPCAARARSTAARDLRRYTCFIRSAAHLEHRDTIAGLLGHELELLLGRLDDLLRGRSAAAA